MGRADLLGRWQVGVAGDVRHPPRGEEGRGGRDGPAPSPPLRRDVRLVRRSLDARLPAAQGASNVANETNIKPFARDFRDVRLSEIDRTTARAWALENPTVARYARTMFEDARNDGLIEANPFANLRLKGSTGRRDEKMPTAAQLSELADAALTVHREYGPEMRAMILFAAYVGLREGELYGLEWDDVDFSRGEVRIERQYVTKIRRVTPPRTGARAQ